MTETLREAAMRYLASRPPAPPGASLERVMIEVQLHGRTELVTIQLREGELHVTSSDGKHDGPHAVTALGFVAGLDEGRSSRPSYISLPNASVQVREIWARVAAALEDVLTAVSRAGVANAADALPVQDAVARLLETLPGPKPAGLERFVGLLRTQLEQGDVARVARTLDGAARLIRVLREGDASALAQQRSLAWLGDTLEAGPDAELLSDRTLVDLGREWLTGVERASIERRYFVDPRSGQVYREDRMRHEAASLGSSPREVSVGLASVQRGPEPRRMRVLQYTVQPLVSAATWQRLQQSAVRDFERLAQQYRDAIKNFPALAEPFAVIAPASWDRDVGLLPVDGAGNGLPLARHAGASVCDRLEELCVEGDPAFVVGSLTDLDGRLMLRPIGAAFWIGQTEFRYERLV